MEKYAINLNEFNFCNNNSNLKKNYKFIRNDHQFILVIKYVVLINEL